MIRYSVSDPTGKCEVSITENIKGQLLVCTRGPTSEEGTCILFKDVMQLVKLINNVDKEETDGHGTESCGDKQPVD